MKKLLASSLIIFSLTTYAQSQEQPKTAIIIQPALIEFNGGMYQGNTAEVNAPSDMVEDVIKEKFKAQGVKSKDIKGFMVFRNARISKIDAVNPVDAFIKVERNGKKDDNMSTISFISTPPGQISDDKLKSGIPTANVTSPATTAVFLVDLNPDIDRKVFEQNVLDQQELIKKAEKKLKDLQEDETSITKKMRKLQEDMRDNCIDQQKHADDLDSKRHALNQLLLQRPADAAVPKG